MSMENEILVLSGTANPKLAEDVVKNMNLKLGDMEIRRFADGEVFVQVGESVRNKDVYVIQPTGRPSSNENWMELYCIIDALKRASAKRITAVIPYYGYSRQDRKNEPRVPITAKLVANLLTESGVGRVLSLDLHAAQIQGFFDIPVDHMQSKNIFLEKIRKDLDISNSIIVSPDIGGIGRARLIAKALKLDIAIIDKRRDRANECEVMNIIGDVKGKDAIIIDDIIDTGGTLIKSINALKQSGMRKIFVFITHAVCSGDVYERINASEIEKLYITDSLKVINERLGNKIEVISVAPAIADAIRHIHTEMSISVLFDK
ncbi:ribose-phosphate pyrophosphokinase [Brachyspira aalborgi]|jgi:ribose-phosphate pyrophosphokinase|uniref:Ribose-phosphate pyrophosphokinase n=2 Tax=Brachyspira TaxID=29521 RepID=A0A5C8EER2_9SPIR|nr:ribose-phosphate pyrophosphokinase [Brachyspira aalborgi]MBS4764120.1 ribose-phosphate pyrophosphokinase [Brachyspira sp.]TXJ20775.1 ribose-phosphate pyrophosphokinase [Brachyspira aalborgi]TXJ31903.1 ribose-phosphate pyrophosphokinase [Brachyspira aalborgi]TXJ33983.1 ribose-phosphate pyrophosphokinase [Brachyspira aalborgi]TXJ36469.1 ribose-phosphate pyrophosphokinase [Brachyspira aalborgi]